MLSLAWGSPTRKLERWRGAVVESAILYAVSCMGLAYQEGGGKTRDVERSWRGRVELER
jgi:hypothetical protein